jgi:hypothetical protein
VKVNAGVMKSATALKQLNAPCGGKNHGVGLKQAQDNVHQIAERIIADHNLKIKDHQIIMFGDTGK